MGLEITKPGVYDMTNDQYQADPVPGGSLSSTGARRLLPPSCPAIFKWERDHGRADKRVFDVGHAAHDALLGGGPEIVEVPGEWRSKDTKEAVEQIRARGAVPLHTDDMQTVTAMAAELRKHPVASRLLSPDYGTPEASLFWTDEATGVQRRARLDVLPHHTDGRMIVPDYKTSPSAEPAKFAKTAADFGYHMQAPYYIDGIRALGLAEDVAFVFVVQQKTPPYLVSVVQLDVIALRIGERLNRRAIETYAQCTANDHWPAYTDDVELVSLPAWYERAHEEDIAS